jgi:hypothetical protein
MRALDTAIAAETLSYMEHALTHGERYLQTAATAAQMLLRDVPSIQSIL